MKQLKVIGTEDDTLVVATESGERFVLAIDDALRAEIRRSGGPTRGEERDPKAVRLTPREIQGHIRSGMSAADVAALTGARAEDIARFEGPVLAEREFIVAQALAMPVLIAADLDGDAPATFGSAIRGKLAELQADGVRWTSWKDATGWIIKVEFTAAGIEHDARWTFDPRRSHLSPVGPDATQLSRQGSLPEGLIPRLRALDSDAPTKDETRFDSAAFGPRRLAPTAESGTLETRTGSQSAPTAVTDAAIKRAPNDSSASAETADLLEALRRRRGQREPRPDGHDEPAYAPPSLVTNAPVAPSQAAHEPAVPERRSSNPIALFDALDSGNNDDGPAPQAADPAPTDSAPADPGVRRKGRASLPSWDEIVFGARTDEH